ncbi:MAG TPA: aspartate/glutamate racemase family protein [Tahibacter sp.]|uniref:aspartate/glutamate racemase family protein n=1 Tax=Tahibacter sp. TaxID=2056211 RepID=UPI002CFBEE26|nr:aspartate/glutamate racemase family protein [Tahibacter sp.]HSX61990.1 aspartate/glutamate racemase family protein [Tahibacter sp.]
MKTLGLLGGMSWESTIPYYRIINERLRERLGGLHSARLVLYSVDFAGIEQLQRQGDWDEAGRQLGAAAGALARAGAQAIVICTNTMHNVAAAVEAGSGLPLLHIADATAARIHAAGIGRIGLLGTRFTMEQDFYRARLQTHGIASLVPDAAQRDDVHRIIYGELCRGEIRDDSRERYRAIMADLVARGAEGIILGCTEIGLLVGAADTTVPTFDTTRIHAEAAADWALD